MDARAEETPVRGLQPAAYRSLTSSRHELQPNYDRSGQLSGHYYERNYQMLDQGQIDQVAGSDAYGSDGSKIGSVGQVYLDDQTGQPAWVTVNTGLFGTNESFIPLSEASFSGDRLTVPYDKNKVKGAPNVAADGHLSPEEERELYAYYGVGYTDTDHDTTTTGTGYADTTTTTGTGYADTDRGGYDTRTEGHDTSGPTTDDAMTLSEERVNVGTERREAGRARLRKYVVTENVTQTVPVTREEVVVEREPITDANRDAATAGPDISEEEHEVVLHEETPVVDKTVEPVERVRLGTQQTTEQQTVTEQVRKERVDTDADINTTSTTRTGTTDDTIR
jgi:uncharacterized protein (TIGR02271 family)